MRAKAIHEPIDEIRVLRRERDSRIPGPPRRPRPVGQTQPTDAEHLDLAVRQSNGGGSLRDRRASCRPAGAENEIGRVLRRYIDAATCFEHVAR